MIASVLLIILLKGAGISYDAYNVGGSIVSFFLGPSTIALGILIYKNWMKVRDNIKVIFAGILLGSLLGMASSGFFVWLFGGSKIIMLSMMPKSVTSPVSMEIVAKLGGIPQLGVVFTVLSGLLGSVIGPYLTRRFGSDSDVAMGTAMGTTAHGIGTARLMLISEMLGCISGFSMAVAAIVTPFLFIPIYRWFQ